MSIQEWIHRLEEGHWAKSVKLAAVILGFITLALLYDFRCYRGFATQEAMENAQLARNISEGKGFVTDSISPAGLYLLQHQQKKHSFKPNELIPDLATPPVYPVLIGGLMKILPFHFTASENPVYQPEQWIGLFNQLLLFTAALLLFRVARRLFDTAVAWFSTLIFLATDLYWRFSLSGLPTLWLIVLLLGITWCLIHMEGGQREENAAPNRAWPWAVTIGLLLGLGALSRYSFGWLIIPVLVFIWCFAAQQRVRLILATTIAFLVLLTPWLVRNYNLCGNGFGTAGYAVVQNTWAFPEDTFDHSSDLQTGLNRLQTELYIDKAIENIRDIVQNDLPKLGGNWISAFFLAGLFLPFRNPALSRLRLFLLGSLALFVLVQALGRTHLTGDSPDINSENLLILFAPLVIIYGAGMILTLVEQAGIFTPTVKNTLLTSLGALLCAPLLLSFMASPPYPLTAPFFPAHIQRTAAWMNEREIIMTDIPAAVAWYGHRRSLLLSIDTSAEFDKVNKLMPVKAVYLTQRTGDKHFQSRDIESPKSWERFLVGVWAHDEVPDGFPLWKAPAGYWPDQTFLSDRARWLEPSPSNAVGAGKKE